MEQTSSLVSCLMIAGKQPEKTARAILCYQHQTWKNKELVIVGSSSQDLSPLLEDIPPGELHYIRLSTDDKKSMGHLKNIGLDDASGRYIIHWDESDWHHPDRISRQMSMMNVDTDLCWLSSTLLHMDHPEFVHHPYQHSPKSGYAGSLLHRNDATKRYPDRHRDPDRMFLSSWDLERAHQLDTDAAWLIIRGISGTTKERRRFLAGLRGNSKDIVRLVWLKMRGRDRLSHPLFKLSNEARVSFQRYLRESQRLGLISSIS